MKNASFVCNNCNASFKTAERLQKHMRHCCTKPIPYFPPAVNENFRRYEFESAFKGHIRNYRFEAMNNEPQSLEEFLTETSPSIYEILNELYKENTYAKIAFSLNATYEKFNALQDEITCDYYHHIAAKREDSIDMNEIKIQLQNEIDNFESKGSGWKLKRINFLDMNITARYSVGSEVGYGDMNEIPPELQKKKAVLNIVLPETHNDQCFKYAVLAALHHEEVKTNKNQHFKYNEFSSKYNWSRIQFPVNVEQMKRFQSQNKGVYINFFKYDLLKAEAHLVHLADIPKDDVTKGKIINIMAIPVNGDDIFHYVPIINIDRLYNNKRDGVRSWWCDRCIRPFNRKNKLAFEEHRKLCYGRPLQAVKMPKENSAHSFKSYAKTERLPYVVYADTECYLERQPDGRVLHKPYAFGVLLCASQDLKNNPIQDSYKEFVGENCVEDGLHYIYELAVRIHKWNSKYTREPMSMSEEDEIDFNNALKCYICNENFVSASNKVKDHDHTSGKFRGAACSKCNLKKQLTRNKLPVFFHNLQNYDSHLLVKPLANLKEKFDWKDLRVIPHSSEKYIGIIASFVVERYFQNDKERTKLFSIEFKDSCQFLSAPLDVLVKNLDEKDMKYTKAEFSNLLSGKIDSINFLKRKGVFCYEYFDSPDRANERQLPSIQMFFDSLNQKECSREDYDHAIKAWKIFNCDSLGGYLKIYLKLDVYQLADVFETFRNLGLSEDGLDPAHYFTCPGFSWDSAFKMTGVSVDLISDFEMYAFIKRGLRGGLTHVNTHNCKANTPDAPEFYDSAKERREILYVDCNNLYGKALSMKLPYKDFQWMTIEECENLDVNSLDLSSEVGYIMEVDLDYPKEVQDKSTDFPFAPELAIPTFECFTPFMKELYENLNTREYKGCEKLLLTHSPKKNYVVHGELLQFYISQGMELRKIHRGIKFKQAPIFQKYIAYNSKMRQNAKSEFEKDFYKYKNNSVFGKSCEDVEKRINFRLVTNFADLKKLSLQPEFLSNIVFDENLVGVRLCKQEAFLNKPSYIGQTVLDLSKLVMYQWRYNVFPKYEKELKCKIRVLGGDTDSFFLEVINISVNNTLLPKMMMDKCLDTSNYDKNHAMHSKILKANLSCVKDECCGELIREITLLKPKCYAIKMFNKDLLDKKRAKGVTKSCVAKELCYDDYFRVFNEACELVVMQKIICSDKHKIFTKEFKKKALSVFEDKRAWVDKNTSLPYGNYQLGNFLNYPKPINSAKIQIPSYDYTSDDDDDDFILDNYSVDNNEKECDEQPAKRRRLN